MLIKNQPTEISTAEARAFLLAVVALGSGVFTLAFWFGVFGTVFFENLFLIWVASTGALLASLFLPSVDAIPALKSRLGRTILLLPSVWLLAEGLDVNWLVPKGATDWLLAGATGAVVILTFPYILYVLILVTVPDVEQLKQPSLRIALPVIVLMIGVVGLAVGTHHQRFVSCQEFKVAGDNVPPDCRPGPPVKQLWSFTFRYNHV